MQAISKKPIVYLCIPQLFQPLKLWSTDFRFEAQAPELSQLVRQFDVIKNESVQGLDASLFHAIGWGDNQELPVAHYRFQTHKAEQPQTNKTLLCADPVHLEVGMNDITLTEVISDLTEGEAQEMLDELNAHFQQDGLAFVLGSNQHWYLVLPQSEAVETTPLNEVLRKNIANFQPRSIDSNSSINWQVIQNEAQMILHASAVNQQREMAGLTTVNSLWFWGGGSEIEAEAKSGITSIFCNENVKTSAQTIAKAANCDYQIFVNKMTELPEFQAGKNLIILDQLFSPAVHDNLDQYQQALDELDEQVIKPLRKAWEAGQIELFIDGCDGKVFSPLNVSAWQFWKKKPVSLVDLS